MFAQTIFTLGVVNSQCKNRLGEHTEANQSTESTIIVRNVEKQLYYLFIRLEIYVALSYQMRSYRAS